MMLKGKIIFITGASSGIGASVAEVCAGYGASVIVGYAKGRDRAEIICERIGSTGGEAQALHIDVTDPGSIESAIGVITKDGARLDGLVNCAGIHFAGPLASMG